MTSTPEPATSPAEPVAATTPPSVRSWGGWVALGVAGLALLLSALLWQKLSRIQEQLARQSADAGQQSLEAKAWAKQAQDTVKDSTARLTLVEALRMAQQQAQLTGSMEPLLAALKSAQLRVKRAAQPRLAPVLRALEKDLDRLSTTPTFDLPGLLIKLDEGVALVDGLVLTNQELPKSSLNKQTAETGTATAAQSWWMTSLKQFAEQIKGLVRVSRIEAPEAALLSPEQGFFLRENLKLKLLNARLGLLARQKDAARADLASAAVLVRRYADASSRKTTQMLQLLEQSGVQLKAIEMPRLDESLTALTTAAAGR